MSITSADAKARADKDFSEAEALQNKKFSLFSSKDSRFGKAAGLYQQSANRYKTIRDFARAAEAYKRAAYCYFESKEPITAASLYQEAAQAFIKDHNNSEALEMFRSATMVYRENNKHTQAAKLLVEAGKVFLEDKNYDEAFNAFQDAVQIYKDENQQSSACQHLTAMADIRSEQKAYVEAAKIYKEVAEIRLSDRLTQLAATEYMEKCCLCQLAAGDLIGSQKMYDEFVNAAPGFERSREAIMLTELFEAYKNKDNEARATAVANYDAIKRLDRWHTEVHTDIMKIIKGEDDGEEEDAGLL